MILCQEVYLGGKYSLRVGEHSLKVGENTP